MSGVTVGMNSQFWSGFAVALVALVGVSAYAYWGSTVVDKQQQEPVSTEEPISQNPQNPQQQPPPPASDSNQVSVVGSIVCLPHKGSGPSTMECAYGLRAENGTHYGLQNLFVGAWPWPLDVGDRARVEGEVSAPPANEKYDIVGYIDVSTFQKL